MIYSVSAAILGSLCIDGVFGDKKPGHHHCIYCGEWLCDKHYDAHRTYGPHTYHHDDTPCENGIVHDATTGNVAG